MANIAYVRVSTKEQNTGRQHQGFLEKGIKIDKIFEEKISGKNMDRPQLKEMLAYIRTDDRVYVESISRLARSTKDLLEIIDVFQSKGVQFISLKENFDTSTPQGKFVLTIFCALSQLERDTIKERQQEGINLALSEKRPYGRPKAQLSDTFGNNYAEWKAGKIKAVDFMKRENLTKTTFYKLVKTYEEKNK